ncbi:hypothetical protein [Sphingomonas jatrophae]|uniref:Uncharacterized protein n=1 Tax=Sphingomonas jatrophae TaxID=1166337 RepID=A0A1I6K7E8_9SPHN|nr:hypothetical protein [Sphingomonas jatrophae]SFR87142.1 hypothetical protein SAMN05192580_1409 [Sphingomonas jatrophae]
MTLLQEIERHLKRSGTAPSVFGRHAMNDPSFVRDLRNGREPGELTIARVREHIRAATPRATDAR